MSSDLVDRLRLVRSPGIGPVTFRQLLARFGSPAAALEAVPNLAARGGGSPPRLASVATPNVRSPASRRWADATSSSARACIRERLPNSTTLRAPHRSGRPEAPRQADGRDRRCQKRFARQLAYDLGQQGAVVVSGLARGIDTAAHEGSIETGTIGVIAGGLDIFYPPENEARQRAMAERGLVIAEMPPGTEQRARHFPYRNRIIAGLSQGTVVVEAAPRSGSLITARLAGEQGREVMAVPGSPLDPRAQGCNQLIRDGATLIQNAADVLEAVRPTQQRFASPVDRFEPATADFDEDAATAIEDLLGPSPVPVDDLIRLSGASPGSVQMALLELDLAGRLDRHAGGKVSLRPA